MRDPYEANGRLYATTGDHEALMYLLNTAITRGYYDDARGWLGDSYRIFGHTPQLLLKEYALEKRHGTETATRRALQELYDTLQAGRYTVADTMMLPSVREEYGNVMLELATLDIQHDEWGDAYLHLDQALRLLTPEAETWSTAVAQQITVLGHLNRLDEARLLYAEMRERAVGDTLLTHARRFASAYEVVAEQRLRMLVDEEEYEQALRDAQALLEVVPQSEAGLRYAINMSQTLEHDALFYRYADEGYEAYPLKPYFIVKRAVALQQRGRNDEALELLHPAALDSAVYVNPQLVAAYSGVTEEWALLLLQDNLPEQALEKLDIALRYDPKNKGLLYLRGLALEKLHRYDEAYPLLVANYEPSNAEYQPWLEHMRWLHFHSHMHNRVDASYTRATFDSRNDDLSTVGHLYSLASVAYSRLYMHNTYTGQVSYKGIDGYHLDDTSESGGIGLEFMAQWEHTFNDRWSGLVNVSYATRFFNKLGLNVQANYAMRNGWTPSLRLGYRLTPETYLFLSSRDASRVEYRKYGLFLLTPGLSKTWERVYAGTTVDLALLRGSLYYNIGIKGKLFINDDNTSSVGLTAGFGSFPELSFFEQTALRNVSHTNAMVGFDAQYMLTSHLYLGLAGTWNTCYDPYRLEDGRLTDSYRNIYTINAQLHVAF